MHLDRQDVLLSLSRYVIDELLDGQTETFDENSPLVQWGILNSLEIIRFVEFIDKRFRVDFPNELITAEVFANLNKISDAIIELPEVESSAA